MAIAIDLHSIHYIARMGNRDLIHYAYILPNAYVHNELNMYEYEAGRSNLLYEIRYRIANLTMSWPDYPNYVPYRYSDRALIVWPNSPLPLRTNVIVGLIQYVDLDPMLNIYEVKLAIGGPPVAHVREYQLGNIR